MESFKFYASVLALTSVIFAVADNSDPILLVHGLGSPSPGEAFGSEHWAYRPQLEESGLQTLVVGVGKFTSNWDRACETYAQVKGTVVDYGVCHSAEAGHARFGIDYTGQGLYPEWDVDHKVHILGHSMGAQTIRLMEHLLRVGSGCAEDTSEFLTGGHNWLTSMTTLSGTFDGTTFIDLVGDDIVQLLIDIVVLLGGLIDTTFIEDIYDLDFSQWGIEREDGESIQDFWQRVQDAGIASVDNKDLSVYDLSTAGARELNELMPQTYPDTYYFSVATERTYAKRDCFFWVCGDYYEAAEVQMNLALHSTANLMGKHSDPINQKNDGLVNWYGQLCPTSSSYGKSTCSGYNGVWTPGHWFYLDTPFLDHIGITSKDSIRDMFDYDHSAKKLYREHGQRLKALPGSGSGQSLGSVVANERSALDDLFVGLQYLADEQEADTKNLRDQATRDVIIISVCSFIAVAFGLLAVKYVIGKRKTAGAAVVENAGEDSKEVDLEKEKEVEAIRASVRAKPGSEKKSLMEHIRSSMHKSQLDQFDIDEPIDSV